MICGIVDIDNFLIKNMNYFRKICYDAIGDMMQRYFIKNNQKEDSLIYITGTDFNHMSFVMRFKLGQQVIVINEDGEEYVTNIIAYKKNLVTLEIIKQLPKKNRTYQVTLAQSLIKKNKFELILQKATELGVTQIIPLKTTNSIVKLDDLSKKQERYESILKEASEQSERNSIPMLLELSDIYSIPFDDFDYVFTAYARNDQMSLKEILQPIEPNKSILILIGPEGGFTEKEITFLKSKSEIVSLGNTILRSETAALYLLSAIRLVLDN